MGMGGGGEPLPQSMTAELWQGHPKKSEGWEQTIYFFYTVSAIMITLHLNFGPDDSIAAWAQQEARARLILKEKGFTDFKFGMHYQDYVMSDGGVNMKKMESDWEKVNAGAVNDEE